MSDIVCGFSLSHSLHCGASEKTPEFFTQFISFSRRTRLSSPTEKPTITISEGSLEGRGTPQCGHRTDGKWREAGCWISSLSFLCRLMLRVYLFLFLLFLPFSAHLALPTSCKWSSWLCSTSVDQWSLIKAPVQFKAQSCLPSRDL